MVTNLCAPVTGRPERRPELDVLRMVVVLGLVFFHASLVFDTRDDFYVKNAETTEAVTVLVALCVVWAMPALFLVSGLGSWHSLRRRGPGGFAVQRLLRLGVPLVFATLVLLPFPQWIRAGAEPSYAAFWPRFFEVRVELAEFPFVLRGEHYETGHLWFVLLLLVFSLMLAALARLVPPGAAARVRALVGAAAGRRGAVLLLPAVPLALISALLGLEEGFGGWHRWAYLLFFLYGFALAADDRLRQAMRADAAVAAVLGVALVGAGLPMFLVAGEAPGADPFLDLTPLATAGRALYGAAGWCWVVAILGLTDRRRPGRERSAGGGKRRVRAYLEEAVLPVYVLHQPVVVGVAYAVVGWHAPIWAGYAAIVVVSFAVVFAVYELLVRRTRVTRFLFGMR